MANKTAGKIAAELLKEWNIDHVYGMPGDSVNEFIDELRHEENSLRFIQVDGSRTPVHSEKKLAQHSSQSVRAFAAAEAPVEKRHSCCHASIPF
ncbi:hypothetical protein DT075_35150 [Bacillus licheniformis]|nr:hypothetical protein DT075_35150 [Bacillus licheniformis]